MPLSLSQQLRQTQTLSPQMRQALGLLQAPAMELGQLIRQQVDTNPVLELVDPTELSIDEARAEHEAPPAEERDFDEPLDAGAPPDPAAEAPPDPAGDAPDPLDFGTLAKLDDADYLYSDGGNNEYDPDAEERRQFLFDSIPARESLQQHLMLQLAQAGLPETETQLAEQIVGSLDASGYLRTSLADIAQGSFATLPQAERALRLVQSFHPVGVGARDLRECLLLQLRADPATAHGPAVRLLAREDAFEALAARRFAEAARLAGVAPAEAEEALGLLRGLDPRPGTRFSNEPPAYVRPEIFVRRVDGRWTAFLDEDDLPRVRVAPRWRARHAALRAEPAGETPTARAARREERRYLDEKIRAGDLLLFNIEQRRATLLAVAQAVADAQPGYFERGRAALRPLTMAEIAAKVGVHETTVSRAVSGKYLRSPQGVAELRSLFVGGLRAADGAAGAAASTDRVKEELKRMVDAEDPAAPLSDAAISARFKAEGIEVARRTVAKYRDLLHIPSSGERRKA